MKPPTKHPPPTEAPLVCVIIPLEKVHSEYFAGITGTPDERSTLPIERRIEDVQREIGILQDLADSIWLALEHYDATSGSEVYLTKRLNAGLALVYGELDAITDVFTDRLTGFIGCITENVRVIEESVQAGLAVLPLSAGREETIRQAIAAIRAASSTMGHL